MRYNPSLQGMATEDPPADTAPELSRGFVMDIRQLEALLAVAEEGSFTAAADRLHTVQSNVSGHVHQLEAELGVQLLVRNRRGAVPTEFGVRVLDRARAI